MTEASPPNRVRVKEAHWLRGTVSEVQEPHNGPMAGVWIDIDDVGRTLYLACEVESAEKPCACVWCAEAGTLVAPANATTLVSPTKHRG